MYIIVTPYRTGGPPSRPRAPCAKPLRKLKAMERLMGIIRMLRPGPGREADEHAFKTGRIFALGSFLAYALATFFVLRHHEPWRDEAYTWLVARDLTLPGIIIQMGHAGHPSLWPLLLSIPAKLGFPYAAEFLLHWAIEIGRAHV